MTMATETRFNVYEVYTKHPLTKADNGWRLHYIAAPNRQALETMPLFGEIVLREWMGQSLESVSDFVVWDGKRFLGMTCDFANDLMLSGEKINITAAA
jgi:hypothetical protein